jgi:cytochrome c-type biogenesis protein CcmH
MRYRFAAALFFLSALGAQAQVTPERADIPLTAAQDVQFRALLPDLRCLVCQNESLADSQASLALDLKYEVRGLVASGKSDAEIKKYLTDRYGDFVLFKPPFAPRTFLLWFGPALLVLLGVITALAYVRKSRKSAVPTPAVDAEALRKLLDEQE